jgi:hypothetical protein
MGYLLIFIISIPKRQKVYYKTIKNLNCLFFFGLGMKILLFSELAKKRELQGWHRVGHHINYSENKYRTHNSLLERDINYFELDFQLVCQ